MTGNSPQTAQDNQNLHSLVEDLSAILMATCFMSVGLLLMSKTGLLSGGLPGLALLISYATKIELWILVPVLNLPFFLLALLRLNAMASLRSVFSIALLTFLIKETPNWLELDSVSSLYASIAGGMFMGFGLLALFRHSTTVGGFSVLAYYVQEKFKLRAGYFQIAVDTIILLLSLFYMDVTKVTLSAVAAFTMSLVLILNHKPNRYLGKSRNFGPGM